MFLRQKIDESSDRVNPELDLTQYAVKAPEKQTILAGKSNFSIFPQPQQALIAGRQAFGVPRNAAETPSH